MAPEWLNSLWTGKRVCRGAGIRGPVPRFWLNFAAPVSRFLTAMTVPSRRATATNSASLDRIDGSGCALQVNRAAWIRLAAHFPPGVVAFDALAERDVEDLLAEDMAPEKDSNPLICASCGVGITSRRERLEMNGAHRHTFTNPHGLTFDIGCFGKAENCRMEGEATSAWSWFDGYAWRVCLCAGCGVHLGWRYEPSWPRDGDPGFYGLILDRLSTPS